MLKRAFWQAIAAVDQARGGSICRISPRRFPKADRPANAGLSVGDSLAQRVSWKSFSIGQCVLMKGDLMTM
jgi:hypothetical protein